MRACLLRDRTLILGMVAVLAMLAGGSNGGAQSVGPDGSRQAPNPIGGSGAPSAAKKTSGDLDRSFAGDGSFMTFVPPIGGNQSEASGVAVDAAGGIVVAGRGSIWPFAVERYSADGTLDTTFGSSGIATPFGSGGGLARGMVMQADGRIVVGGTVGGFALARLMPDGSLDQGFGTGGLVSTDLPGRSDVANGVALHADGRIVLAGQGDGPAFVGVALVQYNSDGSLDMTFGTGGIVLSDVFGAANAVAVQPDGRVIVAGLSFAVARFNADGTLDPGFGSGGLVTVPFGAPGTSEALALLVQPDGQIVVGGVSFAGHGAFALARLNADGSLDKRFGHGGMVTTDFGGGTGGIRALVLQPDGGLVAAGGGVPSHSGVAPDFALVRYESNGNLDRSFGMNGLATVDVDNLGASDFVLALAAQPDGRLVAVGGVQQTCEVDGCDRGGFGLARFLP